MIHFLYQPSLDNNAKCAVYTNVLVRILDYITSFYTVSSSQNKYQIAKVFSSYLGQGFTELNQT